MNIREFHVVPSLPESLAPLEELAYNLHWSWDPETVDLFRWLDRSLWETSGHNPVLFLGKIEQERLEASSKDHSFMSYMKRLVERHRSYLSSPSWFERTFEDQRDARFAYFSAEFGIAECLTIYSGGLGMLAGDHLKAASDLGLPLVGVGLLYQRGYFRQYLNQDGWQQESRTSNDFFNMPMRLLRDDDGRPKTISIELPARTVTAQLWQVQVGRVLLILMDTNIPENQAEDRAITDLLYGGDADMRIRQEFLLGIGGLRALSAIGYEPDVCHINEGHAAFLALERIRRMQEERGLSFDEAREATSAGNVFTTHTPVPAGFDLFEPDLMEKYFSEYREQLGLSKEVFLGLGREDPTDAGSYFNMAVMAIRLSGATNAVSRLHATVSRKILGGVWPGVPENEVPISHVTNGVHFQTWVSRDMSQLLQRYLGQRWLQDFTSNEDWRLVSQIPDEELWHTHERRRERLVATVRNRLIQQLQQRGAPRTETENARDVLHPDALTIGFARRFATYKRATLILEDSERLKKILLDKDRPVQIIFAGKAHPQDNPGKELIRELIHFIRDTGLRRRLVFLEDYDMDLARDMVQGVDVWLNTPRRMMEASGTSGMKAAINGAINLSVLDGWWHEAYTPDIGWSIGGEERYDDLAYQDEVESRALYEILEKEVVPLFFDRAADDLPRRWIALMKKSMESLCPVFNARRMAREYTEQFYVPAARRRKELETDDYERSRDLSDWKQRLAERWSSIELESIDSQDQSDLRVGEELQVRASLRLGEVHPSELSVELYYGGLDDKAEISDAQSIPMNVTNGGENGIHEFEGRIRCDSSGRCGFALRIVPNHPNLASPYELGLISWF